MKTMELRPCNRRGDSLAVALTRSLFAIVLAIVIALILAGAHAQSPQDLERTSAQEAVRNRLHRQGLALWLCGHKRIPVVPWRDEHR